MNRIRQEDSPVIATLEDSSRLSDGRRPCLMEMLEQRLLLSGTDLLSAVQAAMIDYAQNAGPQTVTLPQADLGGFLTIDGVSITVESVTVSGGQLTGGSASLSMGSGALFPDWDSFGASMTDGDDADDWALVGTYEVGGGFSLTVDGLSLSMGQVFTAQAEGISIGYDPDASGPQTLATVDSGTISFPLLKLPGSSGAVQGSLSGLEVRTDGFAFGELSVSYTGEVTFGGSDDQPLLSLGGVGVGITNFDLTFSPSLSISGGIEIFAASAGLFPEMDDAPFQISISDSDKDGKGTSAGLSFSSTGELLSVQFMLDKLEVKLTDYFTFSASGINLDTGAGDDELLLEVGELNGTLKVADLLSVSVGGGHFGITGAGALRALPGFGVWVKDADFNKAMQQLGWPTWVSVTVAELGAYWPDFGADPLDFQVVLSGSIGAMFEDLGLPMNVEGSVTNARFDVGELLAGRNPLVGLDAASFSIGGELFGGSIGAEGTLGIIRYDASFQEVTDPFAPYEGTLLYAGFGGKLGLPGFEFQLRLGFSELGPLAFYGYADVPILLEPNSGLSIGGFRAGVSFYSSLPDPVDEYGQLDPTMLRSDAFAIPGEMSWTQWSANLRDQALAQLQSGASLLGLFSAPMVITGGGKVFSAYATQAAFAADATVMIDTSGRAMLQADVEFGGGMIEGVKMYLFGSLANIQAGNAQFAFLVDLPGAPRIASVYGYAEILFLDEYGDPISSILETAHTMQMRVGGGAELTALGLAEATLEGDFVLSLDGLDTLLTSDWDLLFTMTVTAELSVTYLGDIGQAAGTLVIDTWEYVDDYGATWNLPEMHGALYVQTNLEALRAAGIYAFTADPYDPDDTGASGLLRINTSPEIETVTVTMPADDPNLGGAQYTWDLDPLSLSLLAAGGFQFRLFDVEWFTMHGLAYLNLDPLGVEALIAGTAYLLEDPQDAEPPLLSLDVLGFLSLSPAGLAAVFDATVSSNFPDELDLTLEGEIDMALNTSSQLITLTVPDDLPGLEGGTVSVPGSPYPGDPAGPYLRLDVDGTLEVAGLATLDGMFHMLLTLNELEIDFDAQATLFTIVWTLDGGMRIDEDGLVAAFDASLDDGIPDDLGFTLVADITGKMNLTGQDTEVAGIQVDADEYFVFHADGGLNVLGLATVEGTFDFAIETWAMEIDAHGLVVLGPIVWTLDGGMRLDEQGLAGALNATLNAGLGIPLLSLSATCSAEVNTTGQDVTVGGILVEAENRFTVHADGTMTALWVSMHGTFDFAIRSGYIGVDVDAEINFFNGRVYVSGLGKLYYDGHPGLVLDVGLGVDPDHPLGIPGIMTMSSTLGLEINTRSVQSDGLPAKYARIDFSNSAMTLLGVLKFDGSGYAQFVNGTFRLELTSFHCSLFSLASIDASGWIQSDGQYDLYFDGYLSLGSHALGLDGTASIAISQIGSVFNLNGTVEANAWLAWINVWSGSLEVRYNSASGLMDVLVRYRVLWWWESFTVSFGHINPQAPMPQPEVYLGEVDAGGTLHLFVGADANRRGAYTDEIDETFVLDSAGAGTARGQKIEVSSFGTTKTYDNVLRIEADAGDGNDHIVLSSTITVPSTLRGGTGIDRLTGGSGSDSLYGQGGRDYLVGGGGGDWLYPGSDDDTLEGGAGDDRYVLEGGFGNVEVIEQAGGGGDTVDLTALSSSLTATIGSLSVSNTTGGTLVHNGNNVETLLLGGGDDTVRVTAGSPGITVQAGGGNDTLVGPDAGATFSISGPNAGTVAGVTFAGVENLTGGIGNDTFAFLPGGSLAGNLNDSDGNDTKDFLAYDQAVTVNLQTHTATGIGGTFSGIDRLIGSGRSDTLIGPDSGVTFTIDGADAGTVPELAFSGIENLTGGSGNDAFAFVGDGSLTGNLNDTDGDDTLDYSGYAAAVTVNLQAHTATGIGGTFSGIDRLIGSGQSDTLIGPDSGATFLIDDGDVGIVAGLAFSGMENLTGGPGNDTFVLLVDGQQSNLRLDGGAGLDTLDLSVMTCSVEVDLSAQQCSQVGGGQPGWVWQFEKVLAGSGDDRLVGDDGANWLVGNAGDDVLIGKDGPDWLDGGPGNDRMDGGSGDDYYVETPGSFDRLIDPSGSDTVDFSGATMAIRFSLALSAAQVQKVDDAGNTVSLLGAIEHVIGSAFADVLTGGNAAETFEGGPGDDTICAGGGDDTVHGDSGADTVYGGAGNDVLYGDEGADHLYGEAGDDLLYGGTDDDVLDGGDGGDLLAGGDGSDWLWGGRGNDDLDGEGGDDFLYGDSGDDRLRGSPGNDQLTGSNGTDEVDYSAAASGVVVDLQGGWAQDGEGTRDRLHGIEDVRGSAYDDQVYGNALANRLTGRGGNDLLVGRSGHDILVGGAGDDGLQGDQGSDRFPWAAGDGSDQVDGGLGADVLEVEGAPAGDDDVQVAGNEQVLEIRVGQEVLSALGVETLELRTGGGDDRVEVANVGRTSLTRLWVWLGEGDDGFDGQESALYSGVWGEGGSDRFTGGRGQTWFYGGEGMDTADYSASPAGVWARLDPGCSRNGMGGHDWLYETEVLIGSSFADYLMGSRQDDALYGGLGDDRLYGSYGDDLLDGGDGNDWLYGEWGDDTLLGGLGDDNFVGGQGTNLIDGGPGIDMLWFYGAHGRVVIDPLTGRAEDGRGWLDLFVNIEGASGRLF